MKILDIALKDLKQKSKSVFSLVMMFGAPLLITGLLYFAFGGLASGSQAYNLPVTTVQVVNLDRPGAGASSLAAGKMLVDFLQDPSLADVLSVTLADSEAAAMGAVDAQKAGVALIIPPDFSEAVSQPDRSAAVTLYQDPTLTIGPGIVKDLVNHFMDGFSGAKISGQTALARLSASGTQPDPALGYKVVQEYTRWLQTTEHGTAGEAGISLSIAAPDGKTQPQNQGVALIGPVMAGMLIFFVFFMGANGAESLILEDEQGTLARLFTTPTSLSAILGGKFLGILITLAIQISLLLLASVLLFGIRWGQASAVLLVSVGLIVAAAGFGVLLMSFIKTSRQTGPVLGGVMTLMGMLGGLMTTGIPNLPAAFNKASLVTPQGWALHGWKLALSGAGPAEVLTPVLVLTGLGLAFLAVGVSLFRKRFA